MKLFISKLLEFLRNPVLFIHNFKTDIWNRYGSTKFYLLTLRHKIKWAILHPLKALKGKKCSPFSPPCFYNSLEKLKKYDLYDENGEINPIIQLLYECKEINGYLVIDNYKEGGISLVTKKNANIILVRGMVTDIHKKLFHTVIDMSEAYIGLGYLKYKSPSCTYVLTSNLGDSRILGWISNITYVKGIINKLCHLIMLPALILASLILDLCIVFKIDIPDDGKFDITELSKLKINQATFEVYKDDTVDYLAFAS